LTTGLLCGDFIFDAVLHAVKIVAGFAQHGANISNDLTRDVVNCACAFVSNSLWSVYDQN